MATIKSTGGLTSPEPRRPSALQALILRFLPVFILTLILLSASPSSAGVTTRVSVASDGAQGQGNSRRSSMSPDARFVAFYSDAPNLVSGDTNGNVDVFVHDRQTGQTTRVSLATDGTQGNGESSYPSVSADGRYVAFLSYASNLVPGDTNGYPDIFVRDRQTGETTIASVASNGTRANKDSHWPSISADGRYVSFESYASNLVTGDTNGYGDVFVHDRQTGQTSRVSVSGGGVQATGLSYRASMSADGRFVAFRSLARNLVPGDTNGAEDTFVHDRQTGQTTRESVASGGAQGNNNSTSLCISADGRFVAFTSHATDLVPDDTNGTWDLFVRDRQNGATSRVSEPSDGTQENGGSSDPSISSDGRFVAFHSRASNLVPGDTNGAWEIFVHDCWTVNDTRELGDGSPALLSGNTSTAVFSGAFYAEDAGWAGGIKVFWAGTMTEGDRYRISGTLDTDDNGERCINASEVRLIDTLLVDPLYLRTDYIGGADYCYDPETGAGQQGITGALSVNNIGLFIRAFGKVTQKGADYLYIDDGVGARDGTLTGPEENVGVRVICGPTGYAPGDFLEVTGISSRLETPSGSIPRILTRRAEDVRKIVPGP